MPLLKYDFKMDAGADWQQVVQLRDPDTGQLIAINEAVMEIRNANGVLALRLDEATSRCTVLEDGASIQLHITAEESLTYFKWGNYPGSVQAVGYWGIGRAYNYDLFVVYGTGVQDRIMRGFFGVDPNITQPNFPPPPPPPPPPIQIQQGRMAMGASTNLASTLGPSLIPATAPLAASTGLSVPASTASRIFPATNGPSAATAYSGPYVAGMVFTTKDVGWLQGYWWWCCNTGQATASVNAALWRPTGQGFNPMAPAFVAGSTVASSGTLTPGAWNFIPLPTPIALAPGVLYVAAIGSVGSPNGFPMTQNYWGTGGPGVNGFVNGIVHAYSDSHFNGGADDPGPWVAGQGMFTTAGSNASTSYPGQLNSSLNTWVDVSVSTTAPRGFNGPYRLWPSTAGLSADFLTNGDNPENFNLSTEMHLSVPCSVGRIWFYSVYNTTQLPTSVDIWAITGSGLTGNNVYSAVPTWSGPPGQGWVSTPVTGVVLPAGQYKVSCFNGAATPVSWSVARYGYWKDRSGVPALAPNGITNGPLYAPPNDAASLGYSYQGTGYPWNAGQTEHGNSTFAYNNTVVGGVDEYPTLIVGINSASPGPVYETFWIDAEFTPV